MVAADLSLAIERRLAEYLASLHDQLDLAPTASRCGALPVYSDIGGTLLLKPNGEILSLDHADETICPEESMEWRTVAIVAGSRKYPELAALLPVRPASTPDCPACSGSGRVSEYKLLCGECFSLGWKYAL